MTIKPSPQPPITLTGSRGDGKTVTQMRGLAAQLSIAEGLLAQIQRSTDADLSTLRVDIRNYFSEYGRAALIRSMKGKQ